MGNVFSVKAAVKYAKDNCPDLGPLAINAMTYRYHGHSMSDPGITYRTRDEVSGVRSARDPVQLVKNWLTDLGMCAADEIKALETSVRREVDAGVESAKAASPPPMLELTRDIYHRQGALAPRLCN